MQVYTHRDAVIVIRICLMSKRYLLLFLKVTLSDILLAVLVTFASYVCVARGETFIGLLLIVSLTLVIIHVVVLLSGLTVLNGLFFTVVLLLILLAFSLRASFIRLLILLLGHLIITDIITITFLVSAIILGFKIKLLLAIITGFINLIFALFSIISTFMDLTSAVFYIGIFILIIVLGHLRVLRSSLGILRSIFDLSDILCLLWRWYMHGFYMVAVLILHGHRLSDFWSCCGRDLDRRDV